MTSLVWLKHPWWHRLNISFSLTMSQAIFCIKHSQRLLDARCQWEQVQLLSLSQKAHTSIRRSPWNVHFGRWCVGHRARWDTRSSWVWSWWETKMLPRQMQTTTWDSHWDKKRQHALGEEELTVQCDTSDTSRRVSLLHSPAGHSHRQNYSQIQERVLSHGVQHGKSQPEHTWL